MNSKIMIDIDMDDRPIIRIDYNNHGLTDDVRDKLIGRFINELFTIAPGQKKKVDVSLELLHEHAEGAVAVVRLKKPVIEA